MIEIKTLSAEMMSSGRAYQEFISRLDSPITTANRRRSFRRPTGLVEELRRVEERRAAELLAPLEAARAIGDTVD